nr:MAG TPA: hypothetical protein [Bacteriophage sp.]
MSNSAINLLFLLKNLEFFYKKLVKPIGPQSISSYFLLFSS